ncbi:nucleoporin-like protein 2 [Numida meleagris]|uniref:nucleoporin-like protein 2 n=1 Tax=Numida meleagris TaxID=8996 RepID=UPI000B3DECAC|nr:nucleoporin-like protein 2 [Numida meleagris]
MGAYRLFLQGRCRFGDSGWNVHARSRWGRPYAGPGGGGGAGGWGAAGRRSAHLIRSPVFQHTGGGGSWAAPSQGSANVIQPPMFQHAGGAGGGWGAPSQGSTSVIQPPVFQQAGGGQGGWGAPSQGSTNVTQPPVFQPSTWGGSSDGGGLFTASSSASPGNKSAVLTQNGFSALTSANPGVSCRDGQRRLFERIAEDMAVWESSGQWLFSCYSPVQDKPNVSGFLEFSPDEMRLEYYKCRANNDTGNYINSVHQLAQQWRNRVQELKALNASGKASVVSPDERERISVSGIAFLLNFELSR